MNKKMIIMAGGAVLLLGLGGGGFFAFKKYKAGKAAAAEKAKEGKGGEHGEAPKEGEKPHGEEEEVEALDAHGKPVQPAVVVYRNIVNLDRKNAYLKVEFHILVKDAELARALSGDAVSLEQSEFKALMLSLLSGRTLEEAIEMETRESICEDIKTALNEKFAPKPPKAGEEEDPKHKRPKKPIKDVLVVDWGISS